MTGPEHYAEAERLLAVADRHTNGVTYGQEWTLTLTAAHVHATLALAAATAVAQQALIAKCGPTSLSRASYLLYQHVLEVPSPCTVIPMRITQVPLQY